MENLEYSGQKKLRKSILACTLNNLGAGKIGNGDAWYFFEYIRIIIVWPKLDSKLTIFSKFFKWGPDTNLSWMLLL
jgi:hypothetical protein